MLVMALGLALVSTGVLVLTDSAKWLRLAVLAALWSALLGVFLAAKYRRQATDRDSEVADLQSVYELELEREIAARREHELQVEADARRRVEDERQSDLALLRAELLALRENLERLNNGEVLVERFALQARSTRMRTLGEPPARVISAGSGDAGRPEQRRVLPPAAEQWPSTKPPNKPMTRPGEDDEGPPTVTVRRPPARRVTVGQHQPARDRTIVTPAVQPVSSVPVTNQPTAANQQPVPEPAPANPVPQRQSGGRRRAEERVEQSPLGNWRPEPELVDWGAPAEDVLAEPPAPPAEPPSRHGAHAGSEQHAGSAPRAGSAQRDTGRRAGQHESAESSPSGAHTAGTSVTELLAAHSNSAGSRRHRRRD
jgi:hypothetical protein